MHTMPDFLCLTHLGIKFMEKFLMQIPKLLLAWYDEHARILPWRDNPTPYRVWISEIMLQQTRVSAVMPYYERFLQALPSVEALALVDDESLMKLWEGLGYYNRARNLKKAAQLLMTEYNGQLPSSFDALLTLPGIGSYTAGAIASIAFGIPVPAVDGNVLRVISRMIGSTEDITDAKIKKQMELNLSAILPHGRVGDFNQALMELGAIICLPNGKPLCEQCPMYTLCIAQKNDLTDQIPVKTAKKKRRIEQKTIFVLLSQNQVALEKREKEKLLSGLWQFPNTESAMTVQQAEQFLTDQGIVVESISTLPSSKHIFTHIEWHMAGYLIKTKEKSSLFTWCSQDELEKDYAIPSAFRAYTNMIKNLL